MAVSIVAISNNSSAFARALATEAHTSEGISKHEICLVVDRITINIVILCQLFLLSMKRMLKPNCVDAELALNVWPKSLKVPSHFPLTPDVSGPVSQ